MRFPFDQGQRPDVRAVEPEQVERVEVYGLAAPQKIVELRPPVRAETDELTIEDGRMRSQFGRDRVTKICERLVDVEDPRDEPDTFRADMRKRTEAVVLQLEYGNAPRYRIGRAGFEVKPMAGPGTVVTELNMSSDPSVCDAHPAVIESPYAQQVFG